MRREAPRPPRDEKIVVDIPHQLHGAEIRRRLARGMQEIARLVPGPALLTNPWKRNTLRFILEANGRPLNIRVDIFDHQVTVTADVPAAIYLVRGIIRGDLVKLD